MPRAPDEVYLDSRYSGISATGGTHLATSVYLRCPVQEGIETSPVLKVKVWGVLVYQPISIRCTPVLCASWLATALNGEVSGAVFQSAAGAQLGQSSPTWTPAERAYSRRGGDEKGARWDMTS